MSLQDKKRAQDCLELVRDFVSPRSLSQSSSGSNQSSAPGLTEGSSAYQTTIFESPIVVRKLSPSPESNMNAFDHSMAPLWSPNETRAMPIGDFQSYPDGNNFVQLNAINEMCLPPPHLAQQPYVAHQSYVAHPPYVAHQPNVGQQSNFGQQTHAVNPETFQGMPFPKASSSFDETNMPWFHQL